MTPTPATTSNADAPKARRKPKRSAASSATSHESSTPASHNKPCLTTPRSINLYGAPRERRGARRMTTQGLPVPAELQRGRHKDRDEWLASARFILDLMAQTIERADLREVDVLDVGC